MVAVEVGVEQQVQSSVSKRAVDQRQGLMGMAAISGIHKGHGTVAPNQGVVGRKPATFENNNANRLQGVCDGRRFGHR
jgi:hypothetical protein